MLRLKKITVTVLTLANSALFAGTMGPVCTPINSTVPCEERAWDVGITALYLRPAYSANSGYNQIIPTAGVIRHYTDWDLAYDWGFKLEGSYHFNTGNDINVNWYELDTDANGFLVNNHRHYHQDIKWDAVNAEVAQSVDFSPNSNMRFHGGAQYASIRISNDTFNSSNAFLFNNNSKFSGFGPRAGVDMHFGLNRETGIYAKSAAAVLVGTSKFFTGFLLSYGSKHAIVPELESRVGVDYSLEMARGKVTLDAGYMWFNYFNTLHNSVLALFATGIESNFGASGPYVGLKYVGNL